MDKLMSLGQLSIAIIMFVGTIVWGTAHTIMANLSFAGILVVLLIARLMWSLVRTSWVEYQQEKNK